MITDDEIEALRGTRRGEQAQARTLADCGRSAAAALYDRLQQEKQYSSALNDELAEVPGSNVYAPPAGTA